MKPEATRSIGLGGCLASVWHTGIKLAILPYCLPWVTGTVGYTVVDACAKLTPLLLVGVASSLMRALHYSKGLRQLKNND
jgi:hypothetical protein